ncbi:hypothetical protein ACFWPK_04235 [Nocardia sp. NPDC058519]|uniref:hypothetical protein n=1 Tax=Nocardia sp. NPDC058519 TaxID=3346535 RepID=UPI0036502027
MFAVLVVIGTVTKDNTSEAAPTTANVSPEWPTRPDPTSTNPPTAIAPPTTNAPAPQATTVAAFPAGLNPRCSEAPADLVAAATAGLKDRTHTLANTVVLRGADGYEYLGASVIAPGGKLIQRSDVWVRGRGKVYAASGGARNTSTFDRASSGLNVDLAGDDFVTVDRCTYDWSKIAGHK